MNNSDIYQNSEFFRAKFVANGVIIWVDRFDAFFQSHCLQNTKQFLCMSDTTCSCCSLTKYSNICILLSICNSDVWRLVLCIPRVSGRAPEHGESRTFLPSETWPQCSTALEYCSGQFQSAFYANLAWSSSPAGNIRTQKQTNRNITCLAFHYSLEVISRSKVNNYTYFEGKSDSWGCTGSDQVTMLTDTYMHLWRMCAGSWSKRRQVKMTTGKNGESQNGNKPYNECDCVCANLNAVSVTAVVHIRHLKFHMQ